MNQVSSLERFEQPRDPLATVGGYHWCSAENLASILKLGLLSHNEMHKQQLAHVDLSQADVQERRAKLSLYRGGPPLHDYANLCWHPRNPALLKVVSRQVKGPLVVLEFSSDILKFPQARAIPQHAVGHLPYQNSRQGQIWWARNQHLELLLANYPDWDLNSWKGSGVDQWGEPTSTDSLKKKLLQAEVLVPNWISGEYIRRIYVPSFPEAQLAQLQIAKATTSGWTPRSIPIVVCGHLFFESW